MGMQPGQGDHSPVLTPQGIVSTFVLWMAGGTKFV